MNSISENQTIDAEVLDLLFDTNTTNMYVIVSSYFSHFRKKGILYIILYII